MMPEPPSQHFEQAVEAKERAYEEMSSIELAAIMRDTKNQLEAVKQLQTELQREYDLLRRIVIPKKMEEEDVENVRVKGVGTLCLRHDVWASINSAKKNEAFEFLRAKGHGDLITDSIHHKRLASYVKECIKDGEELPSELFNVTPNVYATILK